jgi:ribosome-associated toxin RatA of RatAB toxin-antitoxin module
MWATALFVFLGLVALVVLGVFIVPLFLPKTYRVEKSILVKASPEACFDKVADLNQYRDWNPWSRQEPEASKKVEGTPKTVGHKYSWEGKKIGKGSLTVKKLDPPASAEIELEFIKPFQSLAMDRWTFAPEGGQTRITWINEGSLSYPVARLMGPFIGKNLSQQFETGLESIRQLCER